MGKEREHMWESEAIKTAICRFSSLSSQITSSFRLPTKAISTRLFPCTRLNYTVIPPAQSPVLPLCARLGEHIWAESWQLSSFISATCPSVGLGRGKNKTTMEKQNKTTGHCHIWWASVWGGAQERKNSPSDNFPRRLHTARLMLRTCDLLCEKKKRQSGANLREEAKEKWAGPLGEKFRGLSNGLLPASAHMHGHNTNKTQ